MTEGLNVRVSIFVCLCVAVGARTSALVCVCIHLHLNVRPLTCERKFETALGGRRRSGGHGVHFRSLYWVSPTNSHHLNIPPPLKQLTTTTVRSQWFFFSTIKSKTSLFIFNFGEGCLVLCHCNIVQGIGYITVIWPFWVNLTQCHNEVIIILWIMFPR